MTRKIIIFGLVLAMGLSMRFLENWHPVFDLLWIGVVALAAATNTKD